MTILQKVFERADRPDSAIFLAHEVRWWPAGAVKKLVGAGILREIGPSQTVRCFDCDQQCDVQPDWLRSPITGEVRGFYACGHEEYGGRLSCSLADARQWELHAESVARLLSTELGLAGDVVAEFPGHVYRLGLHASRRGPVDVFLGVGFGCANPETTLTAAKLPNSTATVMLAPATRPPREVWRGPEPTIIRLDQTISWNERRATIDCSVLRSMLQTISPPPAEPSWLTVTEAARLVMADFPHLDIAPAKVRVTRAANAGQVATNSRTGRHRRLERQSLDAWRLAERDRDLAREERY
jgi:hypothetical protein